MFTCPECNSHKFGSSGVTATTISRGHCHGYLAVGQPCTFMWGRADDHLYFPLDGESFDTLALLQEAWRADSEAVGVLQLPSHALRFNVA